MGRLVLIRHGESEGNRDRIFTHTPEVPLTDAGHAQVRAAAEWVAARYRPVAVVSSPFLRARQTAAILAERLALAVRVEEELRELRYAFKVFAPYAGVRKVSIFGSARTRPDAAAYRTAHEFARRIAAEGYMVITGAGSGIMRACQEGAGRERSFGVNIRLPFEQEPNEIISKDAKLTTFRYFFTRKLIFMKEADAAALFPGGFGTHDEAYECLTLVQTGKTKPMPIVFVDAPRGKYWKTWERYVEEHLLRHHLISKEDMALFKVTTSVDQAVEEITRFYRVYHSARIVGDKFVIRLLRPIASAHLVELQAKFDDILTGPAELAPGPGEQELSEFPELPRLILPFNRSSYSRLRQLIDFINQL